MSLSKIPMHCIEVKCMIPNCPNQSMHKVEESNVFNEDEEFKKYQEFGETHPQSTYLCDYHFNKLMIREEYYGKIEEYQKNHNALDGCPFNYCHNTPQCDKTCEFSIKQI